MHVDIKLQHVYQDEYLQVEADDNVKFVYLEWLKAPSTQVFRDSFHQAAKIALELQSQYCLSDARAIPFLDFSDQNWVIKTMAPMLKDSSLKKYARLSTRESLGLLDVHRIYSTLANDQTPTILTQFETFTQKDTAMEWLFEDLGVD